MGMLEPQAPTLPAARLPAQGERIFPAQAAMHRDELILDWEQYEHAIDVAKQIDYGEQCFRLAEYYVIDALHAREIGEQIDAVDATELARQEAFYDSQKYFLTTKLRIEFAANPS